MHSSVEIQGTSEHFDLDYSFAIVVFVRTRTLDRGVSTTILCLVGALGYRFLVGRGGVTFVATLYQAAHGLFRNFLFAVAVKRHNPTNRGTSAFVVAIFNLV